MTLKHLAAAKAQCATLDDFGTTVFTNMPFDVTATGVVFTASGTLHKPGFLRLVLPRTENARAAPHVFSVGFEPEKIRKGSPSPADFDDANFASRITCPVRVAVGFSDTACPPCAVYAAYNEIKIADKAIGHGIGMTHSCHGRFYRQFGAWAKSKEQ